VSQHADRTWIAQATEALGDLGLAVVIVMVLPLVLVVLGAPVVLLVRVILAVVERF
jgi:hypothetical protein